MHGILVLKRCGLWRAVLLRRLTVTVTQAGAQGHETLRFRHLRASATKDLATLGCGCVTRPAWASPLTAGSVLVKKVLSFRSAGENLHLATACAKLRAPDRVQAGQSTGTPNRPAPQDRKAAA